MRIETLEISEFGTHRKRKIDFHPGLNGIRGPNGSGKSTILNALAFAATGDITRFHAVKQKLRCDLADKGTRSYVSMNFTHGKAKATIRRIIPSSQELEIAGRTYNRVEEISQQMVSLLGVNESLLLDYVFVPQWGIFDFIDQAPSVRAKAFAELFNVSEAEEIYKVVGEHKINIPSPNVDIDRVRQRMTETEADLKTLEAKLVLLTIDAVNKDSEGVDQIIADYQKKCNLESYLSHGEQKLAQAVECLQAPTSQHKELLAQVNNYRDVVKSTTGLADSARSELKNWAVYTSVARSRKALEDKLAEIEDHLSKLPDINEASKHLLSVTEQVNRSEELKEKNFEYKTLKNTLTLFSDSTVVHCPTCGIPAEHLKEQFNTYKTRVTELEPSISSLSQKISEHGYWAKIIQTAEIEKVRLEHQLQSLKDQLSFSSNVPEPSADRKELEDTIAVYNDAIKSLQQEESKLRILETQVRDMEALITSKEAQHKIFRIDLAKYTVTEEQYKDARIAQAEYGVNLKRFYETQAAVDVKKKLFEEDTRLVEEHKKIASQAIILSRTSDHLVQVREVFKELPRKVSQRRLEEMKVEINKVLELFDAPFRVYEIKDLCFILKFHKHNRIRPAEWLSGGQRVVFALAFRVVVSYMFAKELGLLCLDEPTAGLDEDNLACLKLAIGRLRELSQARGLQVILVTHDKNMDGLFDRVITLESTT